MEPGHANNKLSKKKIYWFAFYDLRSPSVRYRAYYPLKYMNQHDGLQYELVYPGYNLSRITHFLYSWFAALFRDRESSIIIIQRVRSRFIYALLLKLLVYLKPHNTVYDLDDADFLEHRPDTIYHFLKKCNKVMTGSHELKEYCLRYNANVILNTSPVHDQIVVKKSKSELFTLGWIGDYGGGHKRSLESQFFPALKLIDFNIKLVMIGVVRLSERVFLQNYFSSFKNVTLHMPDNIDWMDEEFIQQAISEFDAGIATLTDEQLHRCKSAFKLKQYLNSGVPVISTNLPENRYFVTDKVNGLVCGSPYEFQAAIELIAAMNDSDFGKMSNAAINSAENFNLKYYTNRITEQLIFATL